MRRQKSANCRRRWPTLNQLSPINMNSAEQASPVVELPAVARLRLNTNETPGLLTFKEKLGYGLGDTASHFVWDMVGFWLLFFYTDIYKIPAAAAGTIMLIARFWDMGIDPVIGIISDRTQTRWGKFRPYILFGAVPYAVLAVLTFTTPDFGETGKIIYAGATYVLLMTAYAAVNLPYSSLAAVMTSDTYERAGLNTYRFICAFVGQLVVTGLALTLAKYFGGGNKAMGFQHTLILFGCLSVVFFFITFMTSKERVQPSKSWRVRSKRTLGTSSRTGPGSFWHALASFHSSCSPCKTRRLPITSNITSARRTTSNCSTSLAPLR